MEYLGYFLMIIIKKMFLHYFSYLFIVFCHIRLLLVYGPKIHSELYKVFLPLILISPLISFIVFHFSNLPTDTSFGPSLYGILLIPSLFYFKKNKLLIVFLIGIYILNMFSINTSGKQLIMIFIIFFFLIYVIRLKNILLSFVLKSAIFLLLFSINIILLFLTENIDGDNWLSSKSSQVTSLFQFFISGNITDVASSPYVRIASLFNIFLQGISNPLLLIFGNGYGGYYRDLGGYFSYVELGKEAFAEGMTINGRFYYTHDSLITVPFIHGILGFILFVSVGIKFTKLSKQNYLALSFIPLLFFVFYFDVLFATCGLILMYLSLYKIEELQS